LARNGFDFEVSKKVMDIEKEDYLKIIKHIWQWLI
jgi:regulatory protein